MTEGGVTHYEKVNFLCRGYLDRNQTAQIRERHCGDFCAGPKGQILSNQLREHGAARRRSLPPIKINTQAKRRNIMSIAIHGDESVDEHFGNLTDEAERILGDLTNLADEVEDIFAGKILNKSGHMYFVNQSKDRLVRALPVFEQLLVQIQKKIRIRNEQSSIYRDKKDAEKDIGGQPNEFKSDFEVAEENAGVEDVNDEPKTPAEENTESIAGEAEAENDESNVISNDDPYTY
jgi:hypothetical protein